MARPPIPPARITEFRPSQPFAAGIASRQTGVVRPVTPPDDLMVERDRPPSHGRAAHEAADA